MSTRNRRFIPSSISIIPGVTLVLSSVKLKQKQQVKIQFNTSASFSTSHYPFMHCMLRTTEIVNFAVSASEPICYFYFVYTQNLRYSILHEHGYSFHCYVVASGYVVIGFEVVLLPTQLKPATLPAKQHGQTREYYFPYKYYVPIASCALLCEYLVGLSKFNDDHRKSDGRLREHCVVPLTD